MNPKPIPHSPSAPDSDARTPAMSRRTLFAGAGAAGALAGAAALLPAGRVEAPQAAVASLPEDHAGGYRETAHVLHYYRTARV
jgi:hypothetical protein